MTAAGLDAPSDNDATDAQKLQWRMIQFSPFRSLCGAWVRRDQSCVFRTPGLAVSPTLLSQLELNPANLEATLEAEWILAFL